MCVLASAVDIDLLTHREAVTGYLAGHRLASFCAESIKGVGEFATCVWCLLIYLWRKCAVIRNATIMSYTSKEIFSKVHDRRDCS